MTDLDKILLDAVAWAKEAGAVHMKYFRHGNLNIQTKLNESDIVTIADKESEQVIINHIHETYPDHSILSEESGDEENHSDWQWVIDPLDGTTNFSAGLPLFCTSIGVRYKGEDVVGVVFAPYINELYTAVKGEGAFLNGNPIHVSQQTDLRRAVLCTGFPVDNSTNPDNNIGNFLRLLPKSRAVRRLGSAAVDICLVAGGCFDGFWEINLHEWDVCAAELIAAEAGAVVERFRPDRNVCILVANPHIAPLMRPYLSTVPAK